jgi:16S rRNA (uracil1498-N3)-methyltransferase
VIRVFVGAEQLDNGRLTLRGAEARHLGGSLRLRKGETVVAITPDGVEHTCKVLAATPSRVEAQVERAEPSQREPRLDIRVCQALLKGDQLERILEYGSEIGVSSFQPMLTRRTVPKLSKAKLETRMERWLQIIRGGAELGQRGRLPELLAPASLAGALAASRHMQLCLLYEGSELPSLSKIPLQPARRVCLLIGPEGGWTEGEVELAQRAGAEPVTLGARIMRPLPAAMAAVSVLLHRSGDLERKETPDE